MTKGHIRLWSVLVGIVLVSSMFTPWRPVEPAQAVGFEIGVFAPEIVSSASGRAALESELGFQFDALKWYADWESPFSTQLANRLSQNSITELSWEPVVSGNGVPHSAIANGSYDSYIRSYAQQAKNFGKPIRFNLAPEMNGEWALWGFGRNGNTNTTFVAMWRHVVDIFRQEGATNVEWIWTPNVHYGGELYSSFSSYYPGDDYVDYLGLDGYNWGSTQSSGWQSFSQVFGPSYKELVTLSNKPIMIMETGSAEAGGNKANWIRDVFTVIPRDFPRIIGLTWFHMNKETDWRINSSTAAKQAFIAGVQSIREVELPTSSPSPTSSSTPSSVPSTTPSSTAEPTPSLIPATPSPRPSAFPSTVSPTPTIKPTFTPKPDKTHHYYPRYRRKERSKHWYWHKREYSFLAPARAFASEPSHNANEATVKGWESTAPTAGTRLVDLLVLSSIVLCVESGEIIRAFRQKQLRKGSIK